MGAVEEKAPKRSLKEERGGENDAVLFQLKALQNN